jgi:hypothetical protein
MKNLLISIFMFSTTFLAAQSFYKAGLDCNKIGNVINEEEVCRCKVLNYNPSTVGENGSYSTKEYDCINLPPENCEPIKSIKTVKTNVIADENDFNRLIPQKYLNNQYNGTDIFVIKMDPKIPMTISTKIDIPKGVVFKGPGNINISNGATGIVVASGAGIEGVTINNENENNCCLCSTTANGVFSISLAGANNSWVKGVTSTFGGTKGHIDLTGATNCEVSGCLIQDSHCFSDMGGGRAYGIFLANATSNLIVNNVLRRLRHHILIELNSSNNVIAYNTCTESLGLNLAAGVNTCTDTGPLKDAVVISCMTLIAASPQSAPTNGIGTDLVGQIEFHGGGTSNNLVEGNDVSGCIKYWKGGKSNNNGGDIIRNNCGKLKIANTPTNPIDEKENGCCEVKNSLYYIAGKPSWWPANLEFPCEIPSNTKGWIPSVSKCKSLNGPALEKTLIAVVDIVKCEEQEDGTPKKNGAIYINVSGGTPPYVLSGVNSSSFTSPTGASFALDPASPKEQGIYYLTVTDSKGIEIFLQFDYQCGKGGELKVVKDPIVKELEVSNESSDREDAVLLSNTKPNYFSLKAFPNPTSDKMTIQYDLVQDDMVSISLLNNYGQIMKKLETEVQKKSGRHEATINKDDLPSGIYYGVFRSKYNNKIFKIIFK